ncbi:hypothetical protein HYDPIDRAFT_42428 [Hydnomerulius pinastri MD-312]|uniref:Uncharacterized protein n=1 Tax=Hydnomerulius pinastri MD-312 TaxID=994086 RepID=A0A0C9WC34_9AGAM|nr:hypothetical protein HYDPIDRAFT_42428 [Hydnomerulius pinastri MD-312]
MERVVEGRWPWPGGEMSPSASEYDYSESASDAASERCEDVDVDVDDSMDMDVDVDGEKRRRKKRRIGKKKKVVDLGPLVGVKRGFRTRERVPMSGGWCGVEVVPSSLAAFPELEGVMDGEDEDEVVGKAKKRKTKGAKGKGKERAMDVDDPTALSNSTTKDDDMEVDASSSTLEHTLPPRMRKPWVQPAAGSSKSTPDLPSRDQQQGPEKAEVWGWRSPPGTNGESPLSAGTTGSEKHGQKETGMVEGTVGVSGDEGTDEQETEFDTETEADGVDDTQQMPPPPMPASLDPTTVSSLAHAYSRSASPRVPVHWEKNSSPRVSASWISPQLPTSTSTSTSTARMIQPQNQGTQLGAPATSHSSAPWSSAVQSQQTNTSSAATLSAHTPAQMQSLSRTQGQPHPNAQLPPPTISPSTPFSKLSLHSPDGAPLSPHTSALFASGEALIPPEQPMTSPPPRKPSKPLHVHPQNEASAPTPVSVPVVRIESPTGETMRDTPAEAQHQRKSPPEERLDDENKRMSSAEPHRVRFTSPEVLNGLPALRGRAIVGDNEDAEVDVVGEVGEVAGLGAQDPATREDEHLDAQSEAMDVDVDVAGDKPSDETSGSSPNSDDHVQEAQNHVAESHMPPTDDQRPNQDSNDLPAASHSHPPQALMSPRSQADALSPAQTISTPADGYASDDDTSLVSPGPDPSSYPQTTHSGPGTQQPAREPSPPPPPKVKMSLKDFALRKKKQREEMAAKASMSPMSADGSGLPPSPNVDGKRELAIDGAGGRDEKADNTTDVVNGQDAEMSDGMETFVKEAHVDAGLNGNGMNVEVNGARDEAVSTPRNTQPLPQHQQASPEEHKATDTPIIAPSLDVTLASPPPTRPPTPPPRASSETTKVQTHTQINGRTDPAPITLKAKVEIMDGVMPSGLVGADDHAPDVVSFAPEPPPPPLTSKQANDIGIVKGSAAGASAPTSTPSTPSASTPFLSSRSTSIMSVPAPSHSHPLSQPYSHPSSTNIQPSRRASHEDGEIPSSTPPKTYLPRSHTPPTQPRSFHVPHPPSPSFTPVSSSSTAPSRRPPPPPLSRSPLSNAPGPGPSTISSRPLPSGPRALRGSTSQPLANSYAPSRPPYVGSQYIPRGPSADRDRTDWDRDRQWAASSRSRGRAGSSGWGR